MERTSDTIFSSASQQPLSVVIGIPAYNEAGNIGHLLSMLCRQKESGFSIREIVVISDGSDDGTDDIVRALGEKDSRIHLITDGRRLGKPERLNGFMQQSDVDVIVVLDADIRIENALLLCELFKPLVRDESVMHVSGHALPLPPETLAERIAYAGAMVWEKAKCSRDASLLYQSEGRIRAFRRPMYREMRFPDASADEAFSFLFGESRGFRFEVAHGALVRYRLPTTFRDYFFQMRRFLNSQGIQSVVFDSDFIAKYYNIGLVQKFDALIRTWFERPIGVTLYCMMIPAHRFFGALSRRGNEQSGVWTSILSTKSLRAREKSRIVISNYDDRGNPWYAGGGAIAVHEVAKRLASSHEVSIVTGSYPGAKCEEDVDGVKYRRIGIGCLGPWVGQLSYWFWLPLFAMSHSFDVWFDSFTPPFGVSILPLVTTKPVIGLIHMLPGADMWRKYHLPFFLFERIGLRWYRHIIVLSSSMEESIKQYNKRARIYVIPNGIDIPASYHGDGKKHILFIGRIEVNQKGLDLLMDAYGAICSKTDYPLVIAGSGIESEMRKLRSLIEALPCANRIRLVGRVTGEEKERLFNEAVSVVVSSRFETFSIAALEALAHGVQVVGFDISGLSAFPVDVVSKAHPFSTTDLAKKILESVTHPKPEHECRDAVKKYRWEDIAESYKEVIDRVV